MENKCRIIGRLNWVRPEETCYKVPYKSQEQARKVARQKTKQKACRGLNSVYLCSICNRWHLTSKRS